MPIDARSIVVAAPDQVSCNLHGEAAILNLENDQYYGLDDIGAKVWSLVQEPRSIESICESLRQEYDVPADQCVRDVSALIAELVAEGLVHVRDAAAP